MKSLLETVREGLGAAIYYCNRQAESAYSNGAHTSAVDDWNNRAAEYQEILDRDDLVVLPRKIIDVIDRKDIGLSAMTLLKHLGGIDLLHGERDYFPKDKSDFGRCSRLFRAFPELRERLPEMAAVSPEWAVLVSRWDALEEDFRNRNLGRTSKVSYDPRDCCIECFEAMPCSCVTQ